MQTQTIQPARPDWKFGFLWVLATAAGALAGPLFAFPANLALVVLFGVQAPLPGTPTQQALTLSADAMGASMAFVGLGMGLGQWLLLRKYLPHSAWWIPATGLAMLLAGVFRWSLPADTPRDMIGPLTVPSGALLLAVCQWSVLRGRVAHAAWWVIICVGGWLPAFAVAVAALYVPIPNQSPLAAVLVLGGTLLPVVAAAGGMVWLLRQTTRATPAMA